MNSVIIHKELAEIHKVIARLWHNSDTMFRVLQAITIEMMSVGMINMVPNNFQPMHQDTSLNSQKMM
jgi:hypothetical protein